MLKDGAELFVSELPCTFKNVLKPETAGFDYYGGPVKIQGVPMVNSVPAMPKEIKNAGVISIDLSVEFAATNRFYKLETWRQ